MRPLVVVELKKPIERALERAVAGEVLPAKRDPPVLVEDGLLQPLHKAIGPRMARLGPGDAHTEGFAPPRERALEFLPVVPSEKRS
jgi:hypothetical protein